MYSYFGLYLKFNFLDTVFNNSELHKADQKAQEGTAEPQYIFTNYSEFKEVYPDGISSDNPAYKSKFDKDGDGWGCDK